ncbi:MAG: hypothetical protein K1X67_11500 [Fimbriimonadaceae bacterium]|nr:hypothetical protein [Fimbriimonadaceae bacterium]
MARRSKLRFSGLIVTVGMAGVCVAAPSAGRFSFKKIPPVPGFRLDSNGFRAASPTADTLRFLQPAKSWSPSGVSATGATYLLGGSGRSPDKLRVNLLSPGFELHFQGGFGFASSSNLSPFITWSEGSIGPGVPTAKASWFIVSFQESQPPILLAFPGSQASIKLSGKPGAWRIDSIGVYQGWMRVALPVGIKSLATTDAATLGQMVVNFKRHAPFFTSMSPVIDSHEARVERDAVVMTWRMNRGNIVLPYPAVRASKLGYRIQVQGKVVSTGIDLDEGPLAYTPEPKIVVRFPRVELPPGRAVAVGTPPNLTPASPLEVPKLVQMALAVRLANAPATLRAQLQGLTDDFGTMSPSTRDPISKIAFPFDPSGAGIDVAAAHSLVAGSLGAPDNPMLDSLRATLDWLTWRYWPASKNASALGSLAGWLSARPEDAALGAMLEAGLVTDKAVAPLESVRKSAYRRQLEGMPEDRVVSALRSSVRSQSEEPVLASVLGAGYRLTGAPGAVLLFGEGVPVGSELTPAGLFGPGWAKYTLPASGSATTPPLPTPLPTVPGLAGLWEAKK